MVAKTKRGKAYNETQINDHWKRWCKNMNLKLVNVYQSKSSRQRGLGASEALVKTNQGVYKCVSYLYSYQLKRMKERRKLDNMPKWFKEHLVSDGLVEELKDRSIEKSKGLLGLISRFVKKFKF